MNNSDVQVPDPNATGNGWLLTHMVTPNTNSNVNRPVYLARRDVLMEKAMEFLPACLEPHPVRKRLEQIDAVVYLLEAALEPSRMAVKFGKSHTRDDSLAVFLGLALSYLGCARSIFENESTLENAHGPLWKFLDRQAWSESAGSEHIADKLLQDVARLCQAGKTPFMDLKQKLVAALSPEERTRYQRAYEDFKAHGTFDSNSPRAHHMRPNFLASS